MAYGFVKIVRNLWTTILHITQGAVSGQIDVLENSANLEISYKKVQMLSERHDYLLEIKVRNLG
jgi:hypothetical protein